MSNRLLKRERHKVLEKELLALDRRRRKLREDSYITIELEKPLFVGYEKFFVFRTDIAGRPDFPLLAQLLPKINTVLTSKNKHFIKRVRRKTKLANREKGKKTIDMAHKTKDLEVQKWGKLSVKEQGYFYPTTSDKYGNYRTKERTVYRWHYPWMLVTKTQKKYLTSISVPNPDVKSEIKYIDNFIEQRYLGGKLDNLLHGYHTYRRWSRESMRAYLQEKDMLKDMRQQLAELTPSVFEPFYPDFTRIKSIQPNFSEKNNSAFLFLYKKHFLSTSNFTTPI